MDNKVIAIIGWRGSGKTLLGVHFVNEYGQLGKKIYSNITLSIPYKKITLDMLRTLPKELNDSVIFIDEIQMWADAYEFFSKNSKALSTLATQLRKRRIILIFTTQFLKQTIVRLRDQVDYIFAFKKCSLNGTGKGHVTVLDASAPVGEDYIREFLFDGRKYFNLYDTNEVVQGEAS